ncbi:MAG: hypothetical protein H0W64_07270 [Gammaproteobacteria bacterium]|nr:hypothetical protein [Gammaproteobacteria bacterium]
MNSLLNFFTPPRKEVALEDDIAAFIKARDELQSVDKQLGTAVLVDSLLWICSNGYLSLMLNTAFTAGIYLYATQYSHRSDLEKQFQNTLNTLTEHYQKFEDHGPAITHDKTFLKILDCISPFVSSDTLMLWNFNQTNGKDLSEAFKTKLSYSPHRMQFVTVKDTSDLPFFKVNEKSPSMRKSSLSYSGLFEQFVSELKQGWYGIPDEVPTIKLQK